MKAALTATTLALATLSACAGLESDNIDDVFSQALSSQEEDGVLRFVNDCPTTFAILDDDAALDRRAASGIVAQRNGADGTCGTTDDAIFSTMAELDDVPWVGDVALDKLIAHATLLGYISSDDDGIAGDYDGVSFTQEEAAGVLAVANGASLEILDIDIGLDRRAAEAIVTVRPFDAATLGSNMQKLAAASYVGKSALERLKSYVASWSACSTPGATVKGTEYSSLEAHDALDFLNQAPVEVLTGVSGIGTVISGRIKLARPFESLDQLGNVDGVGPSVAQNIHDEVGTRWCPLLGARCGCPANSSYRVPYVAFDENGLYQFLFYGDRWDAERVVDSGFLSNDGTGVVLSGVQVADDPDNWQDIAVQVFDKLWDCCLKFQYFGNPLELGPNRKGTLHLGRVIEAHDGEPYVLVYWKDIDDASFGWLFEKDSSGAWVLTDEVFLN